MSLTFSRRSFLKYTAVAAVAVAGSSLLTGCKDDDNKATRTEYGKITVLQAQSTLSGATYASGKLTFDFSVKCGRGNPMRVNNSCFSVEITSTDDSGKETTKKYASDFGNLMISQELYNAQLKKDKTAEGTVTISGVSSLGEKDVVTFFYQPDADPYTEFGATWKLTGEYILSNMAK
uniref:twin-arginine translocation signal domain-containing protein n=1 Tax=Faecalibacterium prausnitzii TaxID=853 RepID=UPI0040271401